MVNRVHVLTRGMCTRLLEIMNRDNKGRFSGTKSFIENVALVVILGGLVVGCVYAGISSAKLQAVESYTAATSTAPTTRQQQVEALVQSLTEQRMKDPSFQKQVYSMARLDAMNIIALSLDPNSK